MRSPPNPPSRASQPKNPKKGVDILASQKQYIFPFFCWVGMRSWRRKRETQYHPFSSKIVVNLSDLYCFTIFPNFCQAPSKMIYPKVSPQIDTSSIKKNTFCCFNCSFLSSCGLTRGPIMLFELSCINLLA